MSDNLEEATKQQPESPEASRDSFGRAGESIRGVGNIFSKRLDQGMYPLLSKDSVSKINAAATSIEKVSPTTREEYERVSGALGTMAQEFEKYGTEKSSGPLRDDSDSLRGLATYARQAQNEVCALQKTMARNETQQAQDASTAANRLADILEQIGDRSLRAAGRLDGYLRR